MDSFFSLFDPSDGSQSKVIKNKKQYHPEPDTAKKKTDAPKGRRRSRRSQGKNETLPEESSFLCEPDLSTDLLVKDGSYIESYFEAHCKDEEATKTDSEKKPKRRNSARKNRRRKNKISPVKETSPNTAWSETTENIDETAWNNQAIKPKNTDENIGKNVNDLTRTDDDFKKNKRKDESNRICEKVVYNVIDKLEKVSFKDDMYLAGDFNAEDLDNDPYYSSDEFDDSFDDTLSETDQSSEEVYGRLPPEPRFGNVEYKLQLVARCERRFQHLVTQLKWRLRSGGGSAVYVVGVRDCGALVGLRARALRSSLRALRRMASALGAVLQHVTVRRVAPAPQRAVAEVYVRKLADTQQSELRIAVMGANEAGKSTLIGVLTQGELDNGRGSARLNMFRHLHEVKSGRTSSLSHEILGFDAQGNVVNYGCSELMTAERIGERSAKLVSFLDLAGHSKYQRTTLHGLTGYCPHYAMILISATAGITRITEEHLGLFLALDLPFFAVITKCELAPSAVNTLVGRLAELLAPSEKKPLLITDENLARECVSPHDLILDTVNTDTISTVSETDEKTDDPSESVPVFPVSCVTGVGLNALHAYLLALQPVSDLQHKQEETCEFQIDEIFHVGDSTGPVVGGLLARGQLYETDDVIIGPLDTGEFVEISVKSIYRNRVPHGSVKAGQSASLGLSHFPPTLRPGMVLLAVPENYRRGGYDRPKFGGCPPGKCKNRNQFTEIIKNKQNSKNESTKQKKMRKIDKNYYQDLARVESSIAKDVSELERDNIYEKSDSESEMEKSTESCACADEVLLEDPNDPRGCIFFQASVHVLRHSTAISPGFQCTVHVGNVRQTAIIEGIMSRNNLVRTGESASVVFRFSRCPEYLVTGRRLLFTAGLGTRGTGRVTQVFPHVP